MATSRRTALREVLRKWEPAAGPNGFEGLIAHALAELTGFTFRLARSGMQFGRDAATPSAPFSIAMEAKRYSKSVPLQELVGKATLAAFALAEGVDVWVLAATIEVGEGTERQLAEILETGGIALLTLDWTDTGMPPLATLLASVLEEVLSWAQTRLSAPKLASLRAGLEDIAGDSAFAAHRNTLNEKLSPALVGLDALRAHNLRWCETHFGSQRRAQRAFSQFLNPLETPALSAARPAVQTALEAAFATARADPEGDTLVAVLGAEGAGKSWAVATWWHSADPRPILLLSVGRLADLLLANDHPLDMLARLADVIDATLTRFIQPIVAEEPADATIMLEVGDDPTDMRISLVDRGEQRDDPVAAFNAAANDATGEVFGRRRQVLHQQLERFMVGLTDEGALMVARRPFTIGLTEVAREFPERYIGWLERIVDTTDERALRRLQNLGIALAQNYVGERLELAAQTFAHLWKIEPHVTMLVGAAKHSFRDLALFTAPASAEIDQLRVSAFEGAREDASIERLVVAAEAAGAGVWLDTFVESHAASTHPSDQALALTAASFRRPNCQSTELFDRDWRRGFLGHAADAARARYKTALQSEHWLRLAAESVEPRERWQLLQLAVAAADRRQLINPDPRVRNAMREIGGDVSQRLDKAVEKASEEAKKIFMGMRKPTGLLDRIVRA